jgi:hypothetical protein
MNALENIAAEVESKVGHLGFYWNRSFPAVSHNGLGGAYTVLVSLEIDDEIESALWYPLTRAMHGSATTDNGWFATLKVALEDIITGQTDFGDPFTAAVLRKALDSVEA